MAEISIETFKKVELKVGRVISAEEHPDADRLLVLSVDVGEEAPRQLVAGIKANYTVESLVGRYILVVTNLEPVNLRGVRSQGMLLAGKVDGSVTVITPDVSIPPGTVLS